MVKVIVAVVTVLAAASPAWGQQPFDRSRDRGTGIPLSQFGTYVSPGMVVVYPFFEYYHDDNFEYAPSDLGYVGEVDFRGRYRASEGLLFVGLGVSSRLAVELEAAVITARLDKAATDSSALPARLEQSGLGDVEGQLRWRWRPETGGAPEVFSYFETVFPFQRDKLLIGTPDWEFKLGTGVVRGFRWGTVTARAAVAYSNGLEPGEYAVEYLKRVSSGLRLFGAVEGSEDEVELITEAQVFLLPNLLVKLNNAVGLTSKAAGWAPEVGLMFWFSP